MNNKVLKILYENSEVLIFGENGKIVKLNDFEIEDDEGIIYFEQARGTTFDINFYFENLKKAVTTILDNYKIQHKWLKTGGLKIL